MARKDTDRGEFSAMAAFDSALGVKNAFTGERPPVIKTGFFALDNDILQIGGIPRRRFTQIYGKPKQGKSNFILHLIKKEQEDNPTQPPVLLDTEFTFDAAWAEYNGVDMSRLYVIQDNVAERAFEKMRKLIATGATGLAIVDSIGNALEERAFEYDPKAKDTQLVRKPGDFARACSAFTRLNVETIHNKNVAVVIINQVREKFGGYGDTTDTPGGWNLKHSLSINLAFARVGYIRPEKNLDPIGMIIAVTAKNSKMGAERKTNDKNHIKLYFGDPGISATYELYDRAIRANVITVKGTSSLTFWVGTKEHTKWRGKTACQDEMKADSKLFALIEQRTNLAEANGPSSGIPLESVEDEGSDDVSDETED